MVTASAQLGLAPSERFTRRDTLYSITRSPSASTAWVSAPSPKDTSKTSSVAWRGAGVAGDASSGFCVSVGVDCRVAVGIWLGVATAVAVANAVGDPGGKTDTGRSVAAGRGAHADSRQNSADATECNELTCDRDAMWPWVEVMCGALML
jgi:hypothetical protein